MSNIRALSSDETVERKDHHDTIDESADETGEEFTGMISAVVKNV
jgi:hypothetical protein